MIALSQVVTDPAEGDPRRKRWVVAGFARAEAATRPAASLFEIAHGADAVAVIDEQLHQAFQLSAETLWRMLPLNRPAVIVLAPRRPPPALECSSDGLVSSFLCSASVFRKLVAIIGDIAPRNLCFELLQAVLNGAIEVDRILVRQIPDPAPACLAAPPKERAALVMAHRGQEQHLRAALTYLSKSKGLDLRVRVGLDVDEPNDYRAVRRDYPQVEFFRVNPPPVGPYVIRHELANRSQERLLTLQDSDDISCSDRFVTLHANMCATGCDMIGSHELRVDEIRREVVMMRFPVDVTASLRECPCHALLHATLMIKREAFFAVGGLSTDQMVASDTQFLMRAFFHLRIRNVDEFLYIRRRHGDSLTVAPKTANGNPLRRHLDALWSADFEAVKRGQIRLEESSLRPLRGAATYHIQRLRSMPSRRVLT
jgi:hypothetical protein